MSQNVSATAVLTGTSRVKLVGKKRQNSQLLENIPLMMPEWNCSISDRKKSKKDRKDQESIQSRTTPVPGYQMRK